MSSQQHAPPVPFADFEFAFDPALHSLFPSPPPLPSSAGLFSASETTDILGFLDNFNWEFDPSLPPSASDLPPLPHHDPLAPAFPALPNPPLTAAPESSAAPTHNADHHVHNRGNLPHLQPHQHQQQQQQQHTQHRHHPQQQQHHPHAHHPQLQINTHNTRTSRTTPDMPPTSAPAAAATPTSPTSGSTTPGGGPRAKPLLSTPQKRLNHILSEQKRRNAIREGYAQLTTLLAPAGAPPGTGMPTRGRPKGSGSRGNKGRTKGKSGVLFRAVEYCHWLEEGIEALTAEVLRVEAAAGISRG